MNLRVWSLVLLLAGGTHALAAGSLHVEAQLATNSIHIGDIAELRVKVTHPAGATVQLPDLTRENRVVVREVRAAKAAKPDASEFSVFLTSFLPGSHTISSTSAVTAAVTGGEVLQTPFPEITLRVESLLTDTNAVLAGIKPPVRWARPWPILLLWIGLGALVLAALIAGLIFWWVRRQKNIPLPPPVPPHVIALQALEALLQRQWIEQENVEPFYVELSQIVRRYIEDRFGLRAPEQTTEEFIRATATSPLLSSAHRDLAASFLEQCDLVKFARHRPGAIEMKAAHASADRLVRETIPPPPAPTTP